MLQDLLFMVKSLKYSDTLPHHLLITIAVIDFLIVENELVGFIHKRLKAACLLG
jgi:hypothetical protein